jgi:hypothetical protein
MAWLDDIADRIEALPAWARPPFYGMFIVYALIAGRALIALPIVAIVLFKSGPAGLLAGVWILIVAGLAGFAGGTVYSLVWPILRRLGRVGAYATGWLCIAAYLLAMLPVLSSSDPASRRYFSLHDRAGVFAIVFCSLLFGTILGHAFASDKAIHRSPKRWVQRKQRVTSRVHPPST